MCMYCIFEIDLQPMYKSEFSMWRFWVHAVKPSYPDLCYPIELKKKTQLRRLLIYFIITLFHSFVKRTQFEEKKWSRKYADQNSLSRRYIRRKYLGWMVIIKEGFNFSSWFSIKMSLKKIKISIPNSLYRNICNNTYRNWVKIRSCKARWYREGLCYTVHVRVLNK